jgi:hypothetical protein
MRLLINFLYFVTVKFKRFYLKINFVFSQNYIFITQKLQFKSSYFINFQAYISCIDIF